MLLNLLKTVSLVYASDHDPIFITEILLSSTGEGAVEDLPLDLLGLGAGCCLRQSSKWRC